MIHIVCNASLPGLLPHRARMDRLTCRLAPVLASALVVAALGCREDAGPPTAPAEPGGPAFSHTASLKVVNSLADPGDGTCNAAQCTLREAINDPQSTAISFAPGLGGGTITLARPGAGGGILEVGHALSITGPSVGITIRRLSADPEFRIFRIASGETVRLANLTIRNGKGDGGGGGGIISFGTLSLTNCVVAGNSASVGGGIANRGGGTLTLTNSTVANNIGGGMLSRFGGTLVLTNTTIADNGGIGISDSRGTVTLIDTRVVGNTAGGISAFFDNVTIARSTIARNSTSGNGGGIRNFIGTVTITRSTIAGNSAAGSGGGIFTEGSFGRVGAPVTLTNSTVSGNSADGAGGGIKIDGPASATLTNSTVTRNSAQVGGGLSVGGEDASLRFTNSIVAQNTASTGPDVLDAGPERGAGARFSLIGDGSGNFITNTNGNQVGSADAPIDPKLGPLAQNGGPTRTHALLAESPAIDAASDPECPAADQRGVPRPQGAACDIGSYERE
jgi:CSLREA domain-containing protein